MSGINISSPSLVTSSKEADHAKKISNLVEKLGGVQQSAAKLIVNFESKHLSISEKTSFIKDSAPQLDKLANGIALIGAHKFSLQESNFDNPKAYTQTLDSMTQTMKASYDELKTLSNTCAASLPADSKWAEVPVQEFNASKTDAGEEKKSVRFPWWTK